MFPGTRIIGYWHFRVTRNSELYLDEQDSGNLLKAVENELHNRRKGDAVRLARNLRGMAFPLWAKKPERIKALEIIRPAVESLPQLTGAFSQTMDCLLYTSRCV